MPLNEIPVIFGRKRDRNLTLCSLHCGGGADLVNLLEEGPCGLAVPVSHGFAWSV